MAKPKYKRILLKLSGEQFEGNRKYGIDPEFLSWLSKEIIKVRKLGSDVVIVVGGGNMVRGASFAEHGMERTMADYMGMLATVMNGMALTDMLEQHKQDTRLMTRLKAESVAEPYIHRRALRHLEKGRVVIIGGGTGNPYVTTDTAAVQAATELKCDAVFKATKVDGVYDRDPHKHTDAKKFDTLSFSEALNSKTINVMDKTALAMAAENEIPLRVFNLLSAGNIAAVAAGEAVGTIVSGR